MLGAIIGDIVGSRFEWHNIKTKDFTLFTDNCFFTDDSVMTICIAKAILESNGNYDNLSGNTIHYMKSIGRLYPHSGYGGRFYGWIYGDSNEPYNSYGNGSAMRVSCAGIVAQTLDEAKDLSDKVTKITHNHPEGLKGAEATAVCIFLAKTGKTKEEIEKYVVDNYYNLDFTLDSIRSIYKFNETCQGTVPVAIKAFLESNSFEDAIRNAISVGGDSDTLAAITGSIAEAFYGIPNDIREKAKTYLDKRLLDIVEKFESIYLPKISG